MNLYLLTQTDAKSYDTYDSIVVVASTAEVAKTILPCSSFTWADSPGVWANSPASVTATLIGKAIEPAVEQVVITSYNAG